MRKILTASAGRRQGAVDGVNLFFGALLGANLGTLDGLRLLEYVQLIAILVGMVMALRILSTSERRRDALIVLLPPLLLLGAMFLAAKDGAPTGIKPDDLHRLAATMAIWVLFVLALELAPKGSGPHLPAGEGGKGG